MSTVTLTLKTIASIYHSCNDAVRQVKLASFREVKQNSRYYTQLLAEQKFKLRYAYSKYQDPSDTLYHPLPLIYCELSLR